MKHGDSILVGAPGAGFYSTPGKGLSEARLAYVLEAPKLERAGKIILNALASYKG